MDSTTPASTSLDDLTVIVVTYNSAHCIPDIAEALTGLPNVFVVDNASNDATVARVSELIPRAVLLANERNVGFGAANNQALKLVKTSFALVLNPDTTPSADFFVQMIEAARRFPEAAIVAPQLIKKTGALEINYRWPAVKWRSSGPEADGPCCVGFVCGAAMLLNMANMKDVGFFDEDFFLYYEDEDLSYRAFLRRAPMVVVPQIRLMHISRGSVKGTNPTKGEFFRGFHHAQSKILFENKHSRGSRNLWWRTLILAVCTLPLRLVVLHPKYIARHIGRIVGLIVHRGKI